MAGGEVTRPPIASPGGGLLESVEDRKDLKLLEGTSFENRVVLLRYKIVTLIDQAPSNAGPRQTSTTAIRQR